MTTPWNPPWRPPQIVVPGAQPDPSWRQRGSATSTVEPLPGILPGQNLKSWENWRAAAYTFIPSLVLVATGWQAQFHDRVTPWVLIALAVIGPLLSGVNTADTLRRIVYGVLGLLSTGGFVAALFVGHQAWIPIASAAVSIISNAMARFYVGTTTLAPKTEWTPPSS